MHTTTGAAPDRARGEGDRGRGGLRSLGRALAHPNFAKFFLGQGVSMIGTWMTRIATGWLVYRLGGAEPAFLLGTVSFVGQSPTFFLTPFTGVLVDRWDRHRLLVLTQLLFGVQSALMATLAFSATGPQSASWAVPAIVVLSLVQGVVNAFDMPTRQAFLVEMVPQREDLANAIALNSSLVNGARLIGPTVAGILIAVVGEGWCFLLDAISYLAVLAALVSMDIAPRPREKGSAPVWQGISEGFRYAFGFAPIRSLLLLLALVSFMGMPYTVLMPIFAADLLKGGPTTLGLLSAASGVGALLGALYLASRTTVLGLGRAIVCATVLFGASLMGFAFSGTLWLSLPLLVLTGLGMMVQMASCNTILQTIVEEDKRGRVMSFYSMAFLGMAPFGSLFAGALASAVGVSWTVFLGGVACLAGAALFAFSLPRLRRLVRPLYVQRGILPEVASGMQAAAELSRPPAE